MNSYLLRLMGQPWKERRRRNRKSTPAMGGALLLVPLAFHFSGAAAAPPRVVGQLLNVTGDVKVQRSSEPVRKASLLFPLHEGDVLRVGNDGSAEVVLFQNGARLLLSGPGAARVGPTGVKSASGTAARPLRSLSPLLTKQMNTPARAVSPRFLGVLVRDPGDANLGPRNPSPNGAVRGAPVILRWAGPVEGDTLRLLIIDGENTVHQEELQPNAREYQVPAGVLRPGQYYVWSVTAVNGGGSGAHCRALLRLLSPAEQAALDRLEREAKAARTAETDDPAGTLLLAQAYEQLGLFEDARAAYQEVLRLRPDDPGVQAALKHLGESAASKS
jgi:hypothetical protein